MDQDEIYARQLQAEFEASEREADERYIESFYII